MFNLIGKTLVVFNAGLSMLFLTLALGIFTNQVDWGWQEPRQVLNMRVPSEIDKRTAAVKNFLNRREQVELTLENAIKQLEVTEQLWPDYHLEYAKILEDLTAAPGPIDVKKVKMDPAKKGVLFFDPAQPGKPVFQEDVFYVDAQGNKFPVKKSFKVLDQEQRDLQEKAKKLTEDYLAEIDKLKEKTELIGGVFDPTNTKKLKPGILDLLEAEKQVQKSLRKEIDEIEPLWVRKLVESQVLVTRRQSLEERLNELKAKMGDKKP